MASSRLKMSDTPIFSPIHSQNDISFSLILYSESCGHGSTPDCHIDLLATRINKFEPTPWSQKSQDSIPHQSNAVTHEILFFESALRKRIARGCGARTSSPARRMPRIWLVRLPLSSANPHHLTSRPRSTRSAASSARCPYRCATTAYHVRACIERNSFRHHTNRRRPSMATHDPTEPRELLNMSRIRARQQDVADPRRLPGITGYVRTALVRPTIADDERTGPAPAANCSDVRNPSSLTVESALFGGSVVGDVGLYLGSSSAERPAQQCRPSVRRDGAAP